MEIRLNGNTNIMIKGQMGAEFSVPLKDLGRSRGSSVRYFIEVNEDVICEAIKGYRSDELRQERAELRSRIREIDAMLGEYDG